MDLHVGASRAAAKGAKRDHRITQCKRCHLGVFESQPREWVTGELTGLVHVDCSIPR